MCSVLFLLGLFTCKWPNTILQNSDPLLGIEDTQRHILDDHMQCINFRSYQILVLNSCRKDYLEPIKKLYAKVLSIKLPEQRDTDDTL